MVPDDLARTLKALEEQPFLVREQGSGTRMASERYFQRHGFKPRVRMALGSNEAIKQAVAGGLGLAVLSLHALGMAIQGCAASSIAESTPEPAVVSSSAEPLTVSADAHPKSLLVSTVMILRPSCRPRDPGSGEHLMPCWLR